MKNWVRDTLIALISITGISVLCRAWMHQKNTLVRVIVFHDVTDPVWFERTIKELVHRYHVLSPHEFQNKVHVKDKINILVTFDDGYASWVRVCAPILAQYGVSALFFVNSGFVDSVENKTEMETYVRGKLLLKGQHQGITWEGIHTLIKGGHAIGGHTVNHVRLAQVEEVIQKEEIVHDKNRIEDMVGREITAFAYPFGNFSDYTEATKQIVRTAGYTYAFTTASSFVKSGSAYTIPRLCIPDALTIKQLNKWIGGAYDVYAWLKKICVR